MGRGDKAAAAKINNTSIYEVSVERSTAAYRRAGRSTAQRGRSSSQEVASTLQDEIHPDEEFLTDARRTPHVRARPSPRCNFMHDGLLEVESEKIIDQEQDPFGMQRGSRLLLALFRG